MTNRIEPAQFFVVDDVTDQFPPGIGAKYALIKTSGSPGDGDEVTIGTTVYLFKTALTGGTPFEVLINGGAFNALLNLQSAINLTGTAGVDYDSGTTKHPWASGGRVNNTDGNMRVTALDDPLGTFSLGMSSAALTWEDRDGTAIGSMVDAWQGMSVFGVAQSAFSQVGSGSGILLTAWVSVAVASNVLTISDVNGVRLFDIAAEVGGIPENVVRNFATGGVELLGGFTAKMTLADAETVVTYTAF